MVKRYRDSNRTVMLNASGWKERLMEMRPIPPKKEEAGGAGGDDEDKFISVLEVSLF